MSAPKRIFFSMLFGFSHLYPWLCIYWAFLMVMSYWETDSDMMRKVNEIPHHWEWCWECSSLFCSMFLHFELTLKRSFSRTILSFISDTFLQVSVQQFISPKLKYIQNTYLWISNSNVKNPENLFSVYMFLTHTVLVHVYLMGLIQRSCVL